MPPKGSVQQISARLPSDLVELLRVQAEVTGLDLTGSLILALMDRRPYIVKSILEHTDMRDLASRLAIRQFPRELSPTEEQFLKAMTPIKRATIEDEEGFFKQFEEAFDSILRARSGKDKLTTREVGLYYMMCLNIMDNLERMLARAK